MFGHVRRTGTCEGRGGPGGIPRIARDCGRRQGGRPSCGGADHTRSTAPEASSAPAIWRRATLP
ncbi:hypothetical protein F750_3139 [Streptomyces sp. PAMC 26508]|nr:hypothetical protein F750_3139 [Streptomyces sp. PAMC 26508]